MLGRRIAKKGRGWTLMVYMVADDGDGVFTNDHLDSELTAIRDAVARHPTAQVAAQADIRGGGITRHFVANGRLVDREIANHVPGSVGTIRDFIKFGMAEHPAERYLIVFWGHGFGPNGLHYGRFVSPNELRSALRTGFGLLGPAIEIVAFMSCQMSVVEVAYEFSGWSGLKFTKVADHIVASQGTVKPLEPFPYEEVLSTLSRNSENAKTVGSRVVDILNANNGSGNGLRFAAPFSLVDVGSAKRVADILKTLASDILATNPFQPDHSTLTPLQEAIHDALDGAHTHDLSLLDLGRLGRRLRDVQMTTARDDGERALVERVRTTGAQLSEAIDGVLVLRKHDRDSHRDTGVSIFCPTHHDVGTKEAKALKMTETPTIEEVVTQNMTKYRALSFTKHTKWNHVVDQARDAGSR